MATILQNKSPKQIYADILIVFTTINNPAQRHLIEIRKSILFRGFNDFLNTFNKLDSSERETFSPIDNDLFEYLTQENQIPTNFPDILNPNKPRVPRVPRVILRAPILSERLIKGAAKQINFFGIDQPFEILPTTTIIINLDLENPLRRRTRLDKIEIYRLANGKYVIQQISEVSCVISSLVMLYTDNGVSIHDPLFFRLLTYSLSGTGVHFGTSCERIDEIISSLKLYIPGKYLLHGTFHSFGFEYDVKYFQELIRLHGSLVVVVGFSDDNIGGHAAVLDSIDNNHAIIREPYHGYAFKISTDILINKKLGKENGEYHFTYLSNIKHTGALTDREEEIRLTKALSKMDTKQKYLKYKQKYLQLKKTNNL
jgi:hypothetical protein